MTADTGDWNSGATDAVDSYADVVGNFAGPEVAWELRADADGIVEVRFVDARPSVLNHDLFLLDGALACRGGAALERGFNELRVEVRAGERYVVVADAPEGVHGPLRATISCSEGAHLVGGGAASPPADRPEPFAPQADSSEGLTNTSADLEALLEFGEIFDGCERWAEHPEDRHAKLLCGKYRFFYEPMGTDGIPAPLLDWVGRSFPDWAGEAFSRFGLVPDPYATTPRPLGFGPSGTFGLAESVGMTCASCHFGRMPDGRYAVGYPNHRYRYGEHMLSLMVGVKAGVPGFDASAHHPDAVALITPMIDAFSANPALRLSLLWDLIPLLPGIANVPDVPYDVQGQYASWRTGTMDFLIAPLSADDEVHTPSRISPLWGIADDGDVAAYGSEHAQLGWTGGTRSILDFARGFVHVGGGELAQWPDAELEPLAEFILSLRAPQSPGTAPDATIEEGRSIFRSAGCEDCHGGPRGGGTRIHRWDEVGTDATLAQWGAPDGEGGLCCGLSDFDHAYDTEGIKAPRLVGLWAFERFLHNGSLDSLEQLLCLVPRPASEAAPFANTGHTFGCDTLSVDERRALLSFLRSI